MANKQTTTSSDEEIEIRELDDVMTDLISRLGNIPLTGKKDTSVLKALFQEMDDLQQKIYQRMDEIEQK